MARSAPTDPDTPLALVSGTPLPAGTAALAVVLLPDEEDDVLPAEDDDEDDDE